MSGFGVRDVGMAGGGGRASASGVETLDAEDGETDGAAEGAMLDGMPDDGDAGESEDTDLAAAVGGDEEGDGETADNDGSAPALPARGAAAPSVDPAEFAKMQAFYAEFSPHADHIRGAMARGLSPQQAQQAAAMQQPQAAPVDPWGDKKGYDDFWAKATDDPKHFRDGLHREIESSPFAKKLLERLEKYDKELPAIKQGVDQTRGRVMFDNWIKANKAEKYAGRIEELIDKHGVKDVKLAYQMAQDEADAKAYRAARAKAGGTGGKTPARASDDDEPAAARKKPLPPAASGARNRVAGGKGSGSSTAAAKVDPNAKGSLMRSAVFGAARDLKAGKKK